ncbi:DsbA family protein [Lactiplantibacillus mudanjiangensis]|uniref:Thioredoxin-fold protein, DsbA family,FrnE-like subfamily [Lactobacillus plantarum WCFS1] n=1 Tax=Lactiplantibacillus mudanjiangensis TaxID=1296538 RepID=A0A660E5C6_9LACO|nr:DsbA family protein [Lactiplantibacillus mudanjiangensis]VDG24726.1 thioredoxin-fold protein, DsbA family,FrnE-like subfamily [Lactobacillus plantarum WCFS1] [Lactiplantibacillus mudanjiangensis]VDG29338.1 thioredoxin-fold protein, DsbA family,FrnE-like subfamily [Lactobacillus plantarum WCFS1] [Lactiplantibacillus mudanjiangensis]
MKELKIITVADPMMGLLWETWPTQRKLETHFDYQIKFEMLMGQLVKNVYDLVDQTVLENYGKNVALNQYWVKLMQIYLQEESITGMPIQMGQNERLFDTDHISSISLDKGLRAISNHNAKLENQVLYEMQYDTVINNYQTTDIDYLVKLAESFGVKSAQFMNRYQSTDMETNLDKELQVLSQLKIKQMPAYIVIYDDKSYIINGLPKYADWLDIISKISEGAFKPNEVVFDWKAVSRLLERHPHISSLELKEAFDVNDETKVIQEMAHHGLVSKRVKNTVFYKKPQVFDMT